MMNKDVEFPKAGKRRRHEPILYHILSFLDTKSAVQTSLLSRDWNRAWKHVPALDLDGDSFRLAAKFDRFVSKVLSLRYDLKLRKVAYVGGDVTLPNKGAGQAKSTRSLQVIDYALSRDVEELVFHRSTMKEFYCDFAVMFSEKKGNHLKALDLRWMNLDHGLAACSGFPNLTNLTVTNCVLNAECLVLSTGFPCLKNLAVIRCSTKSGCCDRIRVHGPRLLSLKLEGDWNLQEIEIFAPELRLFTLRSDVRAEWFLNSALPALDRADIELTTWCDVSRLDRTDLGIGRYLRSLFQCVQSAKTLTLRRSTIEILDRMNEILEQHPSHFKRLDTLILPPNKLCDKVIKYFFGAGPWVSTLKTPEYEEFYNAI